MEEFDLPLQKGDLQNIFKISKFEDFCKYSGYRTFKSLLLVMNKIEGDIGKIIKVYKRNYRETIFTALLIQNGDQRFLVSLGADTITERQRQEFLEGTPQQKILERIFGEEAKLSEEDEHIFHHEYICQINTEEKNTIEDILILMSSVAINQIYNQSITLNIKSQRFYLANTHNIGKLAIENILDLDNEEYNLNVSFYKIEPLGNGTISVQPLKIKNNNIFFIEDDDTEDGCFDFSALFDGLEDIGNK